MGHNNPRFLSLAAVSVFLAVSETRSLTAAAKRHGMTQSATLQLIHGLEKHIGCELFNRNVRPIALTG